MKPMRSLRWLAVGLVVVALSACSSASDGSGDPQDGQAATPPSNGRTGQDPGGSGNEGADWTGPNFTVETFDGEVFELAAQKGTPVVLNFWESW